MRGLVVYLGAAVTVLLAVAVFGERLELDALADAVVVVLGSYAVARVVLDELPEGRRREALTGPSRVSRAGVMPPCMCTHAPSRVQVNAQVTGSTGNHGSSSGPTPSRPHGSLTAQGEHAAQDTHGSITGVTHGGTHGSPPLSTGGDRVQGS